MIVMMMVVMAMIRNNDDDNDGDRVDSDVGVMDKSLKFSLSMCMYLVFVHKD